MTLIDVFPRFGERKDGKNSNLKGIPSDLLHILQLHTPESYEYQVPLHFSTGSCLTLVLLHGAMSVRSSTSIEVCYVSWELNEESLRLLADPASLNAKACKMPPNRSSGIRECLGLGLDWLAYATISRSV